MEMRCAGFKAAVCLIAVLQHCLSMMDEGLCFRGPLGIKNIMIYKNFDCELMGGSFNVQCGVCRHK